MSDERKSFSIPVFVFQLCIVFAMLIVGLVLHDSLPDQIPSHWNIAGEVDAYVNKDLGIYLFPGIALAVVLLFPILSKIDPRNKKYGAFRRPWHIIQMAIVLFFAYMYFVSLYITFNPEVSISKFILVGIGVLFLVMGNYLGKVRQNYFVGIKTPWTLDNEEVWNKTHRMAGWAFLFSGLVILIDGFVQWELVPVMSFAILVAVVWPILYSYILYRRFKK